MSLQTRSMPAWVLAPGRKTVGTIGRVVHSGGGKEDTGQDMHDEKEPPEEVYICAGTRTTDQDPASEVRFLGRAKELVAACACREGPMFSQRFCKGDLPVVLSRQGVAMLSVSPSVRRPQPGVRGERVSRVQHDQANDLPFREIAPSALATSRAR